MKRGLKYASRVVAVLGLFTAVLLAGAIFLTGPVAERLLPMAADRLKWDLSAENVGGNLITGITVRGLSLELPNASVRVPEIRADLRLGALWRRRLVFESIAASSPSVVLHKSTTPAPRRAPRPAGAGGFPMEVEALRLDDGMVRWAETGEYRELADIDAALSFLDGRAEIGSASARLADNLLSAAGHVGLRPMETDLRLEARGPFPAKAHVAGSTRNLTVEAFGFVEGAPWRMEARLVDGARWSGRGDFAHLDLRRGGKAPSWLGPTAGSARFDGTGLVPAEVDARARWEVRIATGPKAAGTATLHNGVARWDAAITGMGVEAKTTGGFVLADKRLTSEGRLRTDPRALWDYTKTFTVAADARWKAAGVLPRIKWETSGRFKDLRAGKTRAAGGRFNLAGTGPQPFFVDGDISLEGVEAGPRPIDDIQVTLNGGPSRHSLHFFVRSGTVTLAGAGEGVREDAAWSMVWEKLSAYDGRRWETAAPFRTAVFPGGFSVTGLDLRADGAVLAAEVVFRDGVFSRLRARVQGLDTRPWAKAGLWPLAAHGVVSAQADLAGKPPFLEGTLKAAVGDLRWNQTALGSVAVDSTLGERALRLGPSHWESPGGSVSVQGTIPLYTEDQRLPAIDLSVRAREMNLEFLAPLIPNASFKEARFTSDLRLSSRDGLLIATGTARLTASRLTFLTKDMRLDGVRLALAARGDHLEIVEGRAQSPKRGSLTLAGTLGMEGPDLTLRADDFQLALAKPNAIGRLQGAVTLDGSWGGPHLAGDIQIREADVMPGVRDENKGPLSFLAPRKKAAPAPAKAPRTTPLTMDLNVWFQRHVWYKDGDTAIEVKGGVNVSKVPYGPVVVLGAIETVRGDYYVYGRQFKVEQGRVMLIGDSPPDPELDIRAVHKAPDSGTTVTLLITGTAKHPALDMTSEPPLSEQDIVSVLVFGATQDELAATDGSAGGDQAIAAISSVVFQELRRTSVIKRLDLDVLRLRQQGEDRQLEVGRYLSDDLFLVYEQTLEEDGDKRLGAEYTLSPRWMLSGRSGSRGNHSLDLLFNYPLN